MNLTSSAKNSADVMRVSGLGKYPKTQDQRCPSCSRGNIVDMPVRRRSLAEQRLVVYGSALVMSCLGLSLGLVALQSHPLAAGLTTVAATAGLMYCAIEFCPAPKTFRQPKRGGD